MVKSLIKKSIKNGKVLKSLLSSKQEGIISAAFVMMVLLAITKLVGFVKVHMFARMFGASSELDIFWAAFTIPDIIFNIVAVGSINAALIPCFAQKLCVGSRSLQKLFNSVFNLFMILLILSGVLVFIFAPKLCDVIISGGLAFSSGVFTEVDAAMMAELMRIMAVSPVILGLSSILTAGLQVNKRFIVPALAPLLYNVGIIVGTMIMVGVFDMGVEGLAVGVVLGSILHLLVQIPLSRSLGLEFKIDLKFWNSDLIQLVKLAVPRVFGLIGEQISILVNTVISMGLGAGALSAFKFGSSLYLLPVQIIGSTISQAAMPTLSLEYQKAAKFKTGKLNTAKSVEALSSFGEIFSKTLQQILFFAFPAVVFVLVLRLPIVRLALGAGAFDWEDTVVTSWVLALFGLAIIMQVVVALAVRAFYAMQDTKTPVMIAFGSLVINIIASIYLTNFFSHYYDWRPILQSIMGGSREIFSTQLFSKVFEWLTIRSTSVAAVGGPALGAGIALSFDAIVLLYVLNKKVRILTWNIFYQPLLRKFLVSTMMFIVMYLLYKWWNFSLDTSTVVSIVGLFAAVGGVGLAVYFITCFIVDVKESRFFIAFLKKLWLKVCIFFSS
ncbi:MAG: murein biosynthesis integral membrane protein MurJ [Patescibacteria group bacterium]|nr:murein biosynthesis integral membrane protein MurJ [Patescibacteria group bacterium]